MRTFTFVDSEDWTALYMDDVLLVEGHSVSAKDLLNAISVVFPNKIENIEIKDGDFLSNTFTSLFDLKKAYEELQNENN